MLEIINNLVQETPSSRKLYGIRKVGALNIIYIYISNVQSTLFITNFDITNFTIIRIFNVGQIFKYKKNLTIPNLLN